MNWHRSRVHSTILSIRQHWGIDLPLMFRTRQLRKIDSKWSLLKIFQLDQSCRAVAKELDVKVRFFLLPSFLFRVFSPLIFVSSLPQAVHMGREAGGVLAVSLTRRGLISEGGRSGREDHETDSLHLSFNARYYDNDQHFALWVSFFSIPIHHLELTFPVISTSTTLFLQR